MLADASRIAGRFSGVGSVWQRPYATPSPEAAVGKASVWFTAYPTVDERPSRAALFGDSALTLTCGTRSNGIGIGGPAYRSVEDGRWRA